MTTTERARSDPRRSARLAAGRVEFGAADPLRAHGAYAGRGRTRSVVSNLRPDRRPTDRPYVPTDRSTWEAATACSIRRSQLLYKVEIDTRRGVVLVKGQDPRTPREVRKPAGSPELWKQVKMRDESLIKCDFIWRRDGEQIVGVLDKRRNEERRRRHLQLPSATGQDFFSDAEWTLTPCDTLAVRSICWRASRRRKDRAYIKLNRVRSLHMRRPGQERKSGRRRP